VIVNGKEAMETIDSLFAECDEDGIRCASFGPVGDNTATAVIVSRGRGAEFMAAFMKATSVMNDTNLIALMRIVRELAERPSEADVADCLRRLEAL
jgi:hypothetical protein